MSYLFYEAMSIIACNFVRIELFLFALFSLIFYIVFYIKNKDFVISTKNYLFKNYFNKIWFEFTLNSLLVYFAQSKSNLYANVIS